MEIGADLVDRVRDGDPRAIAQFVRTHNGRLYRTARAILRDESEAQDAVQEAYMHAIPALASFRAEAALSTWLVRIVVNTALLRRRRLSRAGQVIAVDSVLASRALDMSQDPAPGPERLALDAETRRCIEAAIDALPKPYRAAFVLREVEEMSVEEAALTLGIAPATVRTRCFRARNLLRAMLTA